MELVLGAIALVAAVVALGKHRSRRSLPHFLRTMLSRGLPGACTGLPESTAGPPRPPARTPLRWEWTEVANLTTVDLASGPRGAAGEPRAAEPPLVETR